MHSRARIVLVACLWIGACNCDDGSSPQRTAQAAAAASEPTGEGARPNLPPPEGTPVEAKALTRFAPESLTGDFVADGDAQTRNSPLPNGGKMPGVRRAYKHADAKLTLDITDSLHVATVRELVLSQQGQERTTARSTFKGIAVGNQPALVQFHEATQTAIVNLVVGDRYMVNVKVSPVSSAEPAIAAASGLALTDLAQLDADNPAAAAALTQAEKKAAEAAMELPAAQPAPTPPAAPPVPK